jgi:signal recognition particle subunit SRP54
LLAIETGCDLQRLAAVEQLRQLCSANEIDLYFEEGSSNPVSIANNAMKKAKEGLYDVVLIDTAACSNQT